MSRRHPSGSNPSTSGLRRAALAAALAAALPFAALAAELVEPPPDGTPIREVRIEGLANTDPATLLPKLQLRAGSAFTREAMRGDFEALASQAEIDPLAIAVSYTELEDGAVALVFDVKENPALRELRFIGNVRYSAKSLAAQSGLKEGDPVGPAAREELQSALRRFYSRAGYRRPLIQVNAEPVEGEPGKVDLFVVVDEGERIRIDDLRFEGNESISAFWLRMRLQNTGSWFVFDSYYDERAFETDLRTVEAVYRDRGYLDARARRGDFKYDEAKATVTPVIVIEEGPRYTVSAVELRGVTLLTREEADRCFQRLVGEKYAGEWMQEGILRLKKLYGDQGFIDTNVETRLERDAATSQARVVVQVTEGAPVLVGQVRLARDRYDTQIELSWLQELFLKLSPPVKDEVILREVRLKPGERWLQRDADRTEDRLRRLRVFDEVAVRPEATGNPEVRDAVVETKETPNAGFFTISAGVGSVSGPSATLAYTNNNLFGEADQFEASATVGTNTRDFRVRYFDRYIGDSDFSYEFTAYRSENRYRVYTERAIGTTSEIGYRLSEYTTLYGGGRLETIKFKDIDGDPEYEFKGYLVATGSARIVYDRTDGAWFPTRGYKASGGVEAGTADGLLVKMNHGYDRYFALNDDADWVYAYGHTVGLMPRDAQDVGLSERYFVGGPSTLRGFAPREVGARDPGEKRLAIGGATRLTQRHELRYRFSKQFQGRIFADGAILSDDRFSLDRPRVGVGPGFSADLGPIILDLDVGFAVVRREGDRRRLLSFRIGSDF
ncbi:MAG: outer membrane protein assembly factor [Candidatus Sumerlaeia bacterium]|nr:outer membrane protein assembly factor [Candidatus Sumerlaeia bacterium]